jgi:SpoVK/Ycf46/Vps4 family AAA+-type ATPase
MILTTNRVSTFDEAFHSRIHVSIYYPKLPLDSRRKIWVEFLRRAMGHSYPSWVTERHLDQLAKEDLNGRQIRNVIRTAHALATGENVAIQPYHLKTAIQGIKEFHMALARAHEEAASAGLESLGGTRKRVRNGD